MAVRKHELREGERNRKITDFDLKQTAPRHNIVKKSVPMNSISYNYLVVNSNINCCDKR